MILTRSARTRTRGIAIALGVAAMIGAVAAGGMLVALSGLGQLSPHLRIERVPYFFWYYRHDPSVRTWFTRGLLLSGVTAAIPIAMLRRRRASLYGEARFAREAELRREGLRDDHGIILGRKRGRYLIFGGTEHALLEAPTRSGKGVGVVIPNLLNWRDSVVVLDVKKESWD